ncbi:hypothetical protein C5167_004466 [Papaver somniferum]|uniref:Uncharacterized protein n=1 Tax=Papaver somniferum TaxID=3469 RepID=A0A4Y7J7P2_PAPSO|nr:hypothetical protein C5167_004466 [Papaver somniferum]
MLNHNQCFDLGKFDSEKRLWIEFVALVEDENGGDGQEQEASKEVEYGRRKILVVVFVYPPEKQLSLKYKDLVPFCFPGGLEVHAVERTPSMSELSEILLGQEHFKQSDLSFVFRLQEMHVRHCLMQLE